MKKRLDLLMVERALAPSREKAKAYISGALGAMLDVGKGSGPMNHAFAVEGEY